MMKGLLAFVVLTIGLSSQCLAYEMCYGVRNGARIAHPNDCEKYIVCENGKISRISTCPNGFHFNAEAQLCDLKERAGCISYSERDTCSNGLTICNGQPNGSNVTHPTACGEYAVCNNGCATPSKCPAGQLYNCNTKQCTRQCEVNCPGSGYPCNDQCGCPNDFTVCQGQQNGVNLPHPTNCGEYVVCSNGCALPQKCQAGQLWDCNARKCVQQCEVNCPGSGYPCNSAPCCPNNITLCAGQPNGVNLTNPNRCGEYLTCNNNCATENRCPAGQLWSKNQCRRSCEVNCPGSGYPCPEECNCPNNITFCAGQPNGLNLTNPNRCGEYITCNNNCAIENRCPAGQLWSKNQCRPSCEVNCPGSGYPCNTCSNNITVCNGQPNGLNLANPSRCGEYVTCNNNCAIENRCPAGQLWDSTCKPSCQVNCPGSGYPCQTPPPPSPSPPSTGPSGEVCDNPGVCLGQQDGTFFPNVNNQSEYIVCQCECEIPMPCPSGLIWNNTILSCDYPPGYWNNITGPSGLVCANSGVCVGQEDGALYADSSNSSQYIVCQCECEIAMPCPTGLIFNSTALECDYPDDFFRGNCQNDLTFCEYESDGVLLPIRGNCSAFYLCSFGCAIDFRCPNNLLFNAEFGICDYPANVTCLN